MHSDASANRLIYKANIADAPGSIPTLVNSRISCFYIFLFPSGMAFSCKPQSGRPAPYNLRGNFVLWGSLSIFAGERSKTMNIKKNTVDNVLKAADFVINRPTMTVREAFANLGVSLPPAAGFILGRYLASNPFFLGMLLVYNKRVRKRRDAQEKERLKNEAIRKQQAIIDKLRRENELNQEEIKNLKEMLAVLEDLIAKMDAA